MKVSVKCNKYAECFVSAVWEDIPLDVAFETFNVLNGKACDSKTHSDKGKKTPLLVARIKYDSGAPFVTPVEVK